MNDQASQAAAPGSGLNFARVLRLARKELRETLRDRRTIITLVVMPLLVYPVLSLAFPQFLLTSFEQKTEINLQIAADKQEDIETLMVMVAQGDSLLRQRES